MENVLSLAHEALCKVEGTRPKPFRNALHESWRAGSCFINAALQSLFASNQITLNLREVLYQPHEVINEESRLECELALTYAMNLLSKQKNSYPQ